MARLMGAAPTMQGTTGAAKRAEKMPPPTRDKQSLRVATAARVASSALPRARRHAPALHSCFWEGFFGRDASGAFAPRTWSARISFWRYSPTSATDIALAGGADP